MDRSVLMLIVLAVLIALLALMLVGWRGRQRRQRDLGRPATVPQDPGADLFSARGFYVATTLAGDPLARVAVGGLGYRSRATVTATEAGLILAIPGQERIFLPRENVLGVDRATWTIDRVVEQDGMVLVRWRLPAADGYIDVDSYLRFTDPQESTAFQSTVEDQYLHSTTEGGNAQ